MDFYKRFIGDYARGAAHLSLSAHGAYSLQLDYYATGKGLPDDMIALNRICRAFLPEELQAVTSVAEQYFQAGEDSLRHNSRADEQIADDSLRIETARENGRCGGLPLISGPADVELAILLLVPTNWWRKKQITVLAGQAYPTKKPDIDNVEKAIFDGLNNVVWNDDVQVCDEIKRKRYAAVPCIRVVEAEIQCALFAA